MSLLLAQAAPDQPAPGPTPEHPGYFDLISRHGLMFDAVAAIALLAIALLVVLWVVRSRKKRVLPVEERKPELPAEKIEVQLPPSEAERKLREEAAAAHAEADRLAEERKAKAEQARHAADETERKRLEDEARALREEEERLKRDEYRAKKGVEKEEKERKAREREEVARLEAERLRLQAEEAAARAREAEEAARRKVEAEAGRTLAAGLDKTKSQGFMARLNSFLGAEKQVDENLLAELEEILFTADIGVRTASRLVEAARERLRKKELASADRVKAVIREEVARILDLPQPKSLEGGGPPHVAMVVGVNGAGKTTTLGKLAAQAGQKGRKVVLAAGDTFRAAATEQLDVWAERAKAELVKGTDGADPGSVVFDAVKRAGEVGADLVIADTAGRLHTKVPLMEELKKVQRVLGKAQAGAPHEILLVVDATTGQNAIAQAKLFHEAVGITGIVLTKLDGTAKGGVVIGICDELKIPILWVGVGEKIADLRRFDPKEFVQALFD
jgi:fused signal recognition particle receptor